MDPEKKEKKLPDILVHGQTETGVEKSRERCVKCIYRGYGENLCDYIGITGKARIATSPGVGKACKEFVPQEGEKKRKVSQMTVRVNAGMRPEDLEKSSRARVYQQMRILYDEGMNDRQIGDELGKSPCTVRNWRLREGLASNTERQRTSTAAVMERRREMMALYKQGLDDRKIADKMMLSVKTVRKWRRENKLKSNYERVKKHADE